ncbi:PREDICTED: E2F transcription factor-like E2FF [Tarenaya hassleriana]|uniref:E2F transcription factor-like E2FF n=1 Tax=Tarenaya hassleriana TaxID=28532 RepID=UPI00053C38B6|nr:PREDICTED: E2F transcription factor-like E2FF [Tarenaya hassleriana]
MSSVLCQEMESLGRQAYSRKEKSLGVLVANFLRLYNRDDEHLIELNDAAGKLGVERRRIYDVVNILESIGLVARKGKNQYSWKGFVEVPQSLNELKEEGLKENFGTSSVSNTEKVSYDDEREGLFSLTSDEQENSSSSKLDSKKEKSLWLLAQNFVKLFLCSDVDLITLDSAAKALLSESQDPVNMRTKVRRLYDIANVFSSMNLIEKTHIPETRKPAYRWLGWKGMSQNRSLVDLNEPKKRRIFGMEITNLCSKRNKAEFTTNQKPNGKENAIKGKNQERIYKMDPQRYSKPNQNKSFVYGPFTPTSVSRINDVGNNDTQTPRLQDLENLASTHRPQYCNQALTGLLGHYTEAWKSWYSEFSHK